MGPAACRRRASRCPHPSPGQPSILILVVATGASVVEARAPERARARRPPCTPAGIVFILFFRLLYANAFAPAPHRTAHSTHRLTSTKSLPGIRALGTVEQRPCHDRRYPSRYRSQPWELAQQNLRTNSSGITKVLLKPQKMDDWTLHFALVAVSDHAGQHEEERSDRQPCATLQPQKPGITYTKLTYSTRPSAHTCGI